jgi:hypothetical protein
MKGIILSSFRDYFLLYKSKQEWQKILKNSGLGSEKIILATSNIDDNYIPNVIDHMCSILSKNKKDLLIELGKYFALHTIPKYYKIMLEKYNTFDDFILNVNNIHSKLTQMLPGANPPMFGIDNKNNMYILKYMPSKKLGLIDYAQGVILGALEYYHTNASVNKTSNSEIRILYQ